MRRAERAREQQRSCGVNEAGHALDRACLDGLIGIERRKDRGEGPREERLAGARRPDQEEVVPARGGDLEGALGRLLADDVMEATPVDAGSAAGGGAIGATGTVPSRCSTAARSDASGIASAPSAAASPAFSTATYARPTPASRALRTRGIAPRTGRIVPSSASSPRQMPSVSVRSWPVARRIARAIARSNPAPSLRRSAGARFTVTRRSGNSKPALRIAARTRSRASWIAVSGRPTIVRCGSPLETSTSTVTSAVSRPQSAQPTVFATAPTAPSSVTAGRPSDRTTGHDPRTGPHPGPAS